MITEENLMEAIETVTQTECIEANCFRCQAQIAISKLERANLAAFRQAIMASCFSVLEFATAIGNLMAVGANLKENQLLEQMTKETNEN